MAKSLLLKGSRGFYAEMGKSQLIAQAIRRARLPRVDPIRKLNDHGGLILQADDCAILILSRVETLMLSRAEIAAKHTARLFRAGETLITQGWKAVISMC